MVIQHPNSLTTQPLSTSSGIAILHLCEPSVFLDDIIAAFDRYGRHRQHYLVNTDLPMHLHAEQQQHPGVTYAAYGTAAYEDILARAEDTCALAIFHNVGMAYKWQIARRLKNRMHLHGILWGWELYLSPLTARKAYAPQTRRMPEVLAGDRLLAMPIWKRWAQWRKPRLQTNQCYPLLDALHSYSTILPAERDFMETAFGYRRPWLPFNYPGVHDDLSATGRRRGKSIQVGNSASPTNNHQETIPWLNRALAHVQQIHLPLAYGNSDYAEAITKRFQKAFGDRVKAYRDFVPPEQYREQLDDCGFVVMNHLRQQGLGNVLLSLLQGAKVFLNPDGVVYRSLREKGLVVYRLDELPTEIATLETTENIRQNRRLIEAWRGTQMLEQLIVGLCNLAEKQQTPTHP